MIGLGRDAWMMIGGILLSLGIVAGFVFRKAKRKALRSRRLATSFSDSEKAILDRDFPRWRDIPERLLPRYAGITRVLMEEKNYEPCGGLAEVTDEMKLVIAGQAAILLLELPKIQFLPALRSILVYPGVFRDPGRRRIGLSLGEDRGTLSGESWQTGSVVLSWDNVVLGGRGADDGMNVVIHEFAHQLDQHNGSADGVPHLREAGDYAAWAQVMEEHFEALKEASADPAAPEPFLDPYGATHPAEFFAVISESFFEESSELERIHPILYQSLSRFYGLDPARWAKKIEKSL